MENKKQVAIYVRNATDSYTAIEEQKDKVKHFCEFRDYEIFNIYVDSGFSSNNTDRPAYKKMMSDLKQKKFNNIVVYKLDRITRSIADLEKFLKEINQNNCILETLCENINTSSDYSKFFARMLSLFNQIEREIIKERTLIGGENEF